MRKVYVGVTVEFSSDGKITPLSVTWNDGRRFEVDRVLDVRPAPALKAGGYGMRYTVRILGHETYLWFDEAERKWFVERK